MHADRQPALYAWADSTLADQGYTSDGAWSEIAGEASFRTFHRRSVVDPNGHPVSVIAMDAPPDRENNSQFVELSRRFSAVGIRVPAVLASDLNRGFLLVDDLGRELYEQTYQGPDRDAALEAALQTLLRFQQLDDDPSVPGYSTERFRDELQLFPEWCLDGLLGLGPGAADRAGFDALTSHLLEVIAEQPGVCAHRDFHSRNLIWRPDQTVGVVDFQDALWGPISYDLASLLRDCYVRFSEEEVGRWRARYLELASAAGIIDVEAATFERWLDLTALQRQLKALGIFARLKLRDGRDSHLQDIPPVLDHAISIAQRYPGTREFGAWLSETVLPVLAAKP